MNKSGFPNNTSSRQIRLLGFLILFAFLCSLISILLQNSEIVRDWENRFQSRYYLLRFSFSQPEAIDLPLILVLIDDHSLPVGTPRSPIDRNWLADLISNLSNHKPALIGINILLDRTGNQTADNRLINSIQTAGNVILRSDPFYPTHPSFEKAALDKGTIRFKLDSSDTVQEVCANQLTCQSSNLFHLKILDYYQKIKNGTVSVQTPKMPWMKINFAVANQDTTGKNVLSFPVIKAQEVSQIPDSAFKDKIVLVGTGFPDLFPLYRVPLSSPGITLQETEVVAQVLSMIAGNRFFYSLSPIVAGTILFIILTFISFVTIRKGSLLAILISFMFILAFLISSGWAFAFRDLEIPFVLPAILIAFYTVLIIIGNSVQERFFRMETELQLKQTKIDYLTNELHSHHLFNEFSRLSVMIGHDPKAAKEYLVEFAEMLRSSLKYGDQTKVAIGIQLDYLELYLNQQRLIHKNKLVFKVSIDDTLKDVPAPWHAFFPLVENAVKYSEGFLKQSQVENAEIEISFGRQNKYMVFQVRNPFLEGIVISSSKTGLKNLKDRLSWAYPKGGYQLNLKSSENIWVAELRLPII